MLISPGSVLEEVLAEGDKGEGAWQSLISSIICTDFPLLLQPVHLSWIPSGMAIGVCKASPEVFTEEGRELGNFLHNKPPQHHACHLPFHLCSP